MEKQKNIPALRFPEFTEEWEDKKLDNGIKLISGQHLGPGEYNYNREGIPYFTGPSDFTNEEFYVTKWTNKSKLFGERNDILITVKGSGVGTMMVLKLAKVAMGRQLMAIKSRHFNANFVHYFLSTKIDLLAALASGNLIPGITRQDILTLKLKVPNFPEQQKIASFLSAIDEKLQALKKKKSLLEQYKKGVMQKIFSQEIRFKDDNGADFPEWEEKSFGSIYSFKPTNSLSRDKLNYESGQVRNIHYGDIHTKFNLLFDVRKESVPFINEEISLERINKDNYCKEGDLIIADASEDYADIGKCIEIVNLNNEKVLAGLHTFLARPEINKMAKGFGGFSMKSEKVRLQIMTIAQGTKVLSISTTRLANVKLPIPCLAEQTKIANFLSAIDEKINHCQTQIEKTEQYKKGLLQQMFV